jgi:cytochrome c oxidase subunit II
VRRKLPLVLSVVLLLGLAAAGVAFAGNGGLGPTDPVSPNAERISDSYWFVAIFTGFIFLVVEGALIVFIVRFRRRGRPRSAEGPQIHGSTRLELIWTVAPVVFLALIGSFVFYKLPGIKDVPAAGASDRLDVKVEGRQFYWQFVYENGVVAVDRLRVPLDQVVSLEVTAPDFDVIHSWWIPRLGGKIDAIPGKVNHTWLRATKTGLFKGSCAELCGLQHAAMKASVEVMPRAAFERWLADAARQQKSGSVGLGKETFEGVCLKCHRLSGERLFGPSLGGNPLLTDEQGLATLVKNGRGQMPAVGKGWPDEQFDALLAYTKTLGGTSGG